ncbi:MAG: AI-2E family transporter [Chitinispirillia bacterium]|nr:AI-2E family transporter [Chitinispirillia bacterium]MCL2268567.1 AI-2E family transporter [Chitinispirillia bacterium]
MTEQNDPQKEAGRAEAAKNARKYLQIFILILTVMIAYKVMFDFGSLAGSVNRIISIVSPFLFGFVIAYCINIPVSWLERQIKKVKKPLYIQKFARPISIIVICAITVFMVTFGLRGFIPMIYENAMQLTKLIPSYIEQGLTYIRGLPYAEVLGIDDIINPLLESKPWTALNLNVGTSLKFAQNFFAGIFAVILTAISTLYFLAEYNHVKIFFHRLIGVIPSVAKRNATLKYVRLVDTSFRKFLTCQFLDSLILGSITATQFFLLGSPYALVLGLMLGVVNIIPYFGSIFGSIVAVFITIFSNGWETGLLTAVILLFTQQFDGYFINPRIMGSSFSVSPILVIIAITVGGALGGIAGMIFAIPVANVLKTVLDEFINKQEKMMLRQAAFPGGGKQRRKTEPAPPAQ